MSELLQSDVSAHRCEEQNRIAFGTGGWRALIGEGFTLLNVRRLAQAVANEIARQRWQSRGVLIGFDRRFLSRQAAEAAARSLAPVGLLLLAVLLLYSWWQCTEVREVALPAVDDA